MAADDKPDEEPVAEGATEESPDEVLERGKAIVAKNAGPKRRDPGRWLALIPVTVAALMMLLMMPRATAPDAVPVPILDERALAEVMRADDARAARARTQRLPTDALAIGSAVRELQSAQTRAMAKEDPTEEDDDVHIAGVKLDEARRVLASRADWEEDLLALRAAQMSAFLDELAKYEATGTMSKDLEELGGGFVRRVKTSGWAQGNRVLLDDAQRRAIFKTVWNAIVGVDQAERFALTLDEQRALYTLYITRPYAGEQQQRTIDAMRRNASSAEQCARAAADERRARETWRADKIRRLGQIDPTYPTAYALGVAHYRAGRYDLASDAFRAWIDAHPDGPLAARARNHLKASLIAYGSI